MLASEIASYIASRGLGTVGENIFIGELPITQTDNGGVNSGVYIINGASEGQHEYLDTNYDQLDFWSANRLTESSYEALEDIKNILSRAPNYETANYQIYFSHDISGIMDMDRTADGLKLFKMTIRFIYRDKNIIS
ncbi:MAG: hypothetical protein BWY69_00245 [Planctomycetes bacterium ADurb.Bin401]|nr:MAG: hypothetical protein BWY69_00245 [Planctomycetes bacterium ADurb.Bin401]